MADEDNKDSGLRTYIKAEALVQLVIALPAACFVGWAIGAWLDRHYQQTWISIAGILVGAVGGFIQIFRAANRMMKKDE